MYLLSLKVQVMDDSKELNDLGICQVLARASSDPNDLLLRER